MNRKLHSYVWLLSAVALFICINSTKAQQGLKCPSNVTVNAEAGMCSAVVNDIDPDGNGNFSVQYTLTGATTKTGSSKDGASGERFNVGVTIVTYSHGQQTCQFTVTVVDNQKPTGSNPQPLQVQCRTNIPPPDPAVVTDEADNCGATTVTFRGETNNGGQGCPGSPYIVTRTYRITDGNNNFTDVTHTITVVDDTAPVITRGTIADCYRSEAEAEAAAIAATQATDNCGGTVSTTAETAGECTAVITVTATDACGNSSTTTYNTRIDNTAPVITRGTIADCYRTEAEAEAAAIAATQATDNCGGTVSTTAETVGECTAVITVTATDACGNSSTVIYNTRIDNTPPVVANCPTNMTASTGPNRTTCDQVVTWIEPTALDNCSGILTYLSRSHAPGSVFPVGNTMVTYTFEDACGNRTTCSFTVTVTDNTPPVITCPDDIRLSACQQRATWTAPEATDNCAGVRVAQTGGPGSGSSFANGTTTPVTYTATDASGNQTSCSFTVTRARALSATCNSTATQLYFGLEDYQTAVITGSATGGTGPYTITIAMNRPLICNYIDEAGDETFTGVGGQTENGSCLTRSSSEAPVATMTNVLEGQPYAVNATLLQNATFTITVTDADGCTATCTVTVNAEDVRCFAGRSDIHKVTICHRTSSLKNPCVTICVDESSVATHLAHGDYPGECNLTCTQLPPVEAASGQKDTDPVLITRESSEGKLVITATPVPSYGHFTIRTQSNSEEYIQLRVVDVLGRVIETKQNMAVNSVITLGSSYRPGVYIVEVVQGKERQTLRLLKY